MKRKSALSSPVVAALVQSSLLLPALSVLGSCDVDLGARVPPPPRTLGQIVYSQACQRVAYSGELAQYQAGQRPGLDASGVRYRPMCSGTQDVAPPGDAPTVMQAVRAERQGIVSSVDQAVPQSLEDPLDQAMRAMLPALDGGEATAAASAAGAVVQAMAADPAVPLALTRLGFRSGFRPLSTEGALTRALLDYPELWAMGNAVLPRLWPSTPRGSDAPGTDGRKALLRAVAREMEQTVAVADVHKKDRTARLFMDFLLGEYAELRTLPAGQSLFGVLRDPRGAALVNAPAGVLPAPFADKDRDGLADLDALGRFVGSDGKPVPQITPFLTWQQKQPGGRDSAAGRDASGRAMTAATGGQPLYSYVNLDDTVLAGLLREGPALFDAKRDIPLRLFRGALPLLGPRVPARKDYPAGALEYTGFDKAQAPLLDMGYAVTQLLTYSDAGDATGADLVRLLRGLQLLLLNQESITARNLDAVIKGFDESKLPAYAAAKLAEQSPLYDDLLPVLVRLLRVPGLLNEVLLSLGDPAVRDLGPILSQLMTDSSYVFLNQDQLDATKPGATVGSLGKQVNRAAADSDVDKRPTNAANNRSLLQRVLQLVHDANGIALCNRDGAYVNIKIVFDIKISGPARPCELYQLDDLALYFVLSIADKSVKQRDPYANFLNALVNGTLRTGADLINGVGLLDNMMGIPGFSEYPTPEQLARILFQDNARRADFFKTTLDFGPCTPKRPGTMCSNRNLSWQDSYDGAVFALESIRAPSGSGNNFYKALKPVVNAFAKFDECTARSGTGACTKQRNAVKILVDLLSVLHRHWPTPESRFYGLDYEAQSQKSGVSRYEPLIANLVGKGDLWAAVVQLGPALANTRLDDGSALPVATVLNRFLLWLIDPEAPRTGGPMAFRDGRTMAVRSDGKPTFQRMNDPYLFEAIAAAAAGRVTPFDLLADAWKKKRVALAASPQAATDWNGAVSAAADLYLAALPVMGGYKLGTPRLRPILLSTLELLRGRVRGHATAGDLKAWAQRDLYTDLEAALTGPIAAGLYDSTSAIAGDADAAQKLYRLVSWLLLDPGPGAADAARFQSMLYASADLVQLLLDDADLVPLVKGLGTLLDPERGAVDGLLAVLRRGLPTDTGQVLITIGRNFMRSDSSGRYPGANLSDSISEINRARAGEPGVRGTDFDEIDYREVLQTLGKTLLDEKRGVRRILDVIEARKASTGE